jgi:inorganic pyrophosphatase
MTNLLKLAHRLDRDARTCRAIIETPKGRQAKFDYEPTSGLFELAGMLPTGMCFPLAFGFIPSTIAEVGDPVDVLVLCEEDLPIGCLLSVCLLGVIEAKQSEDGKTLRNDRLLAKAAHSRLFADVSDIADLGAAFSDELASFFTAYNTLKGRCFEALSVGDAARAVDLVAEHAQ